jgi:hypothetical protein
MKAYVRIPREFLVSGLDDEPQTLGALPAKKRLVDCLEKRNISFLCPAPKPVVRHYTD